MDYPSWLARLMVRSGAAKLVPGLQRRLDGGAAFLRYYSDRLLGSPLGQLERVAAALQEAPPDVIDLTAGSPRLELLPSTTRLPTNSRGWPPVNGLPELRGEVAAALLRDRRLAVSPAEEVLITPGAIGAVQVVLDAFVNRGDAVVLTDPVSPLYPLLVRTRGAKVRWLPASCEDGKLCLRFDRLAHLLRGARLLVVNSPHNPTGGVLAAEDLARLAWWCNRHDVLVLSDETFVRFAFDDEAVSIATQSDARKRTLTVGSVSKSHGMPWARVGWVAAHRHLLRPCAATAGLRSPFVPLLEQYLALSALRMPADAFAPVRGRLEAHRRYAFDRLADMGLKAEWPGGGFFLWAALPGGQAGRKFSDKLLSERRVKVAPGDLFGPSGCDRIRISYAGEDGRLDEGLGRIAEALGAGRAVARKAA